MANLRIGGSLQRSLRIELEQTAAIFHRQGRRIFLAEIAAHPATVSRGNQKALRRAAMEDKIKGGRAVDSRGNQEGKTKDCDDDKRGSGHARLFRRDALRVQRLQSLYAHFSA